MQTALFNISMPAAQGFSKNLRFLNNDRRKADYELGLRLDLTNGRTILNRARRAVADFDALDKAVLSQEVSNYLRLTNQI